MLRPFLQDGSALSLRIVFTLAVVMASSSVLARVNTASQAAHEILRQLWICMFQVRLPVLPFMHRLPGEFPGTPRSEQKFFAGRGLHVPLHRFHVATNSKKIMMKMKMTRASHGSDPGERSPAPLHPRAIAWCQLLHEHVARQRSAHVPAPLSAYGICQPLPLPREPKIVLLLLYKFTCTSHFFISSHPGARLPHPALTLQFVESINISNQSLVATALGENDHRYALAVLRRHLLYAVTIIAAAGVGLFCFQSVVVGLFTSDAAVISTAMTALPLILLAFPIDAVSALLDGTLIASGCVSSKAHPPPACLGLSTAGLEMELVLAVQRPLGSAPAPVSLSLHLPWTARV